MEDLNLLVDARMLLQFITTVTEAIRSLGAWSKGQVRSSVNGKAVSLKMRKQLPCYQCLLSLYYHRYIEKLTVYL